MFSHNLFIPKDSPPVIIWMSKLGLVSTLIMGSLAPSITFQAAVVVFFHIILDLTCTT